MSCRAQASTAIQATGAQDFELLMEHDCLKNRVSDERGENYTKPCKEQADFTFSSFLLYDLTTGASLRK